MCKKIKKYIGNKAFYKMVFFVTLPLVLQQVLINVVNLADNVMVGQLTQNEMNGVYISSQIFFVCTLGLFGAIEGSSIFFAQYFGGNDEKHMRFAFKFKCIASIIIAVILFAILTFFLEPLAGLFSDAELEIEVCKQYINILKFTLFPLALSNVLSSSFREVKKTSIPMWASALALIFNISLNYALIFGNFGCKELRVEGAAIATLIARLFEFAFLLFTTYFLRMSYIKKLFSKEEVESGIIKRFIRCSIPLFFNELLWSTGQMIISVALCTRGGNARNALSIATTVNNLFYIGALSLGNAIAIIVGNTLGSGNIEKAKIEARQLIALAIMVAIFFGLALIGVAPLITMAYNVTKEVRVLAINAMRIYGSLMWIFAINCSCFYVIRAGGNTKIVLAFDSVFGWVIQVPVALLFAFLTNASFEILFFIIYFVEIIKLITGLTMVHKNKWAKNIMCLN